MESIIDQLDREAVWEEFLSHRLMKGRFTWNGFDEADSYVADRGYLTVAQAFIRGKGPGIPEVKSINKMGSGKKRTVFCYGKDETRVLKLLAFLLYKYDEKFAPNCYAFRRGVKASDAIFRLRKLLRGKKMWAYKVDIRDYFNSIPIPKLLPVLKGLLSDDPKLYGFFERMLSDDKALMDGKVVHCKRGAMAGTPTAPFLADVFLMEADRYFYDSGIIYARYSDDMILFAPDSETLQQSRDTLLGFLAGPGLEVNPEKERTYTPDEPFEFLGFRCHGNEIGIASASVRKMKGKIRRAAHAVLRWSDRKGLPREQAMKALINIFNKKFFEDEDPDKLSWSRWFFPVINRTDALREIDLYLQNHIRFLSTGRHTKANYRVRYSDLKSLGYRSLVHEYYKFKQLKDKEFILW